MEFLRCNHRSWGSMSCVANLESFQAFQRVTFRLDLVVFKIFLYSIHPLKGIIFVQLTLIYIYICIWVQVIWYQFQPQYITRIHDTVNKLQADQPFRFFQFGSGNNAVERQEKINLFSRCNIFERPGSGGPETQILWQFLCGLLQTTDLKKTDMMYCRCFEG